MAPTQQRSLLATLTAVFVFLMQADPTSGAGFTCAGTGCIAAVLLVGINAVMHVHGESGKTGAMTPAKRDEGSIAFNHITHEGVVHSFINTTALTHDWHFVHAVNQPVNLTDLAAKVLESGATTSYVQEIDFSWTEPSGYGTKTQTGLEGAASGAAHVDGLDAVVGFNFYGDNYATDFPPPCD
ncbi:Ribonuclease III domain family protein [Aspergillus niger]|uniref:Ribonuclease III domain family protein n=1 Tax=Aspergillus niger TaxID=5061 RepID=A0A505I6L7_ASPNG|nr:Ribonuclease III domain family protein [Aspergillus niger]